MSDVRQLSLDLSRFRARGAPPEASTAPVDPLEARRRRRLAALGVRPALVGSLAALVFGAEGAP